MISIFIIYQLSTQILTFKHRFFRIKYINMKYIKEPCLQCDRDPIKGFFYRVFLSEKNHIKDAGF